MLLILSLLIAVIISLSAVSAADDTAAADIDSIDDSISEVSAADVPTQTADTDTISTNASKDKATLSSNGLNDGDNTWYVDSNVETTGDGSQATPYKTIKEAFDATNGNGTIYLASGTYNSADDRGFNVLANSNISIIGAGKDSTTVDMLSSNYFAHVSINASFYLYNIRFINPADQSSGSTIILSDEYAEYKYMHIENCSFENSYSRSSPALGLKGDSIVKNCDFINNTCNGGSVQILSSLGITVTVDGCTFKDNHIYSNSRNGGCTGISLGGAGLGFPAMNITVKNSNFENSFKAISCSLRGNLTVYNCTFTECGLNESSSPDMTYGSILRIGAGDITMDSCTIENNTQEFGNLIYGYNANANLYLINSKFANNTHNFENATVYAQLNYGQYFGNVYLQNNTCDYTLLNLDSTLKSEANLITMDNQTFDIEGSKFHFYGTLTDDNGNFIRYDPTGIIKLYVNDTEINANFNFTTGRCDCSVKAPLNGTYIVKFLNTGFSFANMSYKTAVINVIPVDNVEIYVSTTGSDETGDGSEANPYQTVDKAFDVADDYCSATVYFKAGIYNFTSYRTLVTGGGLLNIIGYGGDVIFDADNKSKFFNVTNNSNVVIQGISFTKGSNPSYNAQMSGLINTQGNLTLKECKFYNNRGYLTVIYGADLIDSCTFENSSMSYYTQGFDVMNAKHIVNSFFYGSALKNSTGASVKVSSNINSTIENSKFYNDASISEDNYRIYINVDSCEFINIMKSAISSNNGNLSVRNSVFNNSNVSSISASGSNVNLYIENNTVVDVSGPYVKCTSAYVTSPTTIVVLDNETIEQESYGAVLRAKVLDDKENSILVSGVSFDFNDNSYVGNIVNDEFVYKYVGILNGTYLVGAKSSYLKDYEVKTGVLVITPLINKDLYVSTTGSDETGDGTEENPFATIYKAMDNAIGYNNTIHIADGVYSIDTPLDIDTNTAILNIVGSGANTVFDMNNETNFISSLSSNSIVEIRDLTLANAKSTVNTYGGFITSSGRLTLNNVNLINSTGMNGGAIRNAGNLTIADSYFEATNASRNGGAVWSNGYLYVINTTFNKTTANFGGAIYSNNYLYINNNTFIDTVGLSNANTIFANGVVTGGLILTVMDNETWDITTNPVTFNATLSDENGNLIYSSGIQVSFYVDGIKLVTAYMNGYIVSTSANVKLNGEHILSAALVNSNDPIVKTATLNFQNPDVSHDVWISENGDDNAGDGTSANPYASFTKALSVVETFGGVIHVMSNYTFAQQVSISNIYGLTVLGETDDIHFKSTSGSIFTVNTGASLNIENIKFTENSNTQTLLNANSGSSLSLMNCSFEDNNYTGAYDTYIKFINAYDGELNLIDCNFVNNSMSTNRYTVQGRWINASTNSNFINCTFKNNSYTNTAGYVSTASFIYIFDTNYKNYVSYFKDCVFEDNAGRLIYGILTFTMDNCSFVNNTGAILITPANNYDTNYEMTIVNSTFEENNVTYLIECTSTNAVNHISHTAFKNNTGTGLIRFTSKLIDIHDNEFDENEKMKYLVLAGSAQVMGSTYSLIISDNGTYDVEGNVINLNVTLMDADGHYILGPYFNLTLNDEMVLSTSLANKTNFYSFKNSESGELLASATIDAIYDPEDLTIKTALFKVTQIENKEIYVDILGSDETGDGSEENPYASLSRAIKDANGLSNTIYIQPGEYEGMVLDEKYTLGEKETLSIIGLSNEVDRVVFKNLTKNFLNIQYDRVKVGEDKLVLENFDIIDSQLSSQLFMLYYIDNVEMSDINILNVNASYLIENPSTLMSLSNLNIEDSKGLLATGNNGGTKSQGMEIIGSQLSNSVLAISEGSLNVIDSDLINLTNINNNDWFINAVTFNSTNSTFDGLNSNWMFTIGRSVILDTVFTNCEASTFFISASTDLLISNSVFASNIVPNSLIQLGSTATATLENNWWGYNVTAEDLAYLTSTLVSNWIVAEVTPSSDSINIGDDVQFDILLKLNDGSELTDVLPTRIVTAIADNTEFDEDEVEIIDNQATITGTVTGTGDITITIDEQDFVFPVNGYVAYLTVDNLAVNVGDPINVCVLLQDEFGALAGELITIWVNEVEYNDTTNDDGMAIFEIDGLEKGNYIVTASFAGDELYDETSGVGLIMVSDAILSIDIPAVDYGSPITIYATVEDSEGNPLSGLVIATLDGVDCNIYVDAGEGSVTIPNELFAGEYFVTAKLLGENNAMDTALLLVNPIEAELIVSIDNITYNNPVEVELSSEYALDGIVILTIDGVDYAIEIEDGEAIALLPILLDSKDYEVTAKFIGENFDVEDATTSFSVEAIETALTLELANSTITYGDFAIVKVSLVDELGNPMDGIVTLTVGDQTGSLAVVNGEGVVSVPYLAAGNYTVTAKFEGSANFIYDEDSASLEVTADDNVQFDMDVIGNSLVISLVDGNDNPMDATVTVTIDGESQDVTVENGIGFIYDLEAGDHTVSLDYDGDADHASASMEDEVTILPDPVVPVSANATIELAVVGDYVEVTLKDLDGNPIAGADLEADLNNFLLSTVTTDDDGKALVDLYGEPNFNFTVTVVYTDDLGSSVSASLNNIYVENETTVIIYENVTVPVTANGSMSVETTDDAITATLTDSDGNPLANATVTAVIDGVETNFTTDENGKLTVPVSENATVELSYTDANGASVTYTTKVVTNEVPVPVPVPVPVTVNGTIALATEDGKSIIATLTDSDGKAIADAELTISVNGQESTVKTDANGKATVDVEGNTTVVATYKDANNLTATGYMNLVVIVNETIINETIIVIPNRTETVIDYQNMTTTVVASADGRIGEYFTVVLRDDKGNALADKPIKIGFNGRVYDRVTDENGSAKLQINLGYKGTYTFAIGFLGDDNYTGAFEVAKITVNLQTPKLSTSSKTYKASAKTKALTATLKTVNGNGISNKKVSFTVNGKTYSGTTNDKGVATVKVSLSTKGTYSFTAKFAGDDQFAKVTANGKLTIK